MEIEDALGQGRRQRVFRARQKVQEPGFISHVTQRAAGKEPLFVEDRDYLTMLALLKESSEKFDLNYYSFCLMPNHIHIMVEPQKKNLAKAMGSIFSRYAAKFNRKYERRGHLFGGPYRQAICLDNSYLLAASVYIHLNPVRAGLCTSALDYRWTSSMLYSSKKAVDSFVDPSPVLKLVHEDNYVARVEYERLIKEGSSCEPENALEQEGVIEKFCNRLAQKFPGLFKRVKSNVETTNPGDKNNPLVEITDLEQMIQDFDSRPLKSPESKKAKKFVVEQLLARGFKKSEIAERLGISRGTVYNLLTADCTFRA
ncbi:MAG: transposase [Desulfonatronovibrio sp.]